MSGVVIDITETMLLTAVRSMLLLIVPPGVEVIRAQVNRVPEPLGADFIVMTPLRRERLETNVDNDIDVIIPQGVIVAGTLDAPAIIDDPLGPGQLIYGPNVLPGTVIVYQVSGTPGGTGQYVVSPVQDSATGPIYAGQHQMRQATEITFQLDIHGPASAETAQIVSTIARDEWACQQLNGLVQPLYSSEPRQMPFINAESQFEDRYIVELTVQANPTVSVPQMFADVLEVEPVNVDAFLFVDEDEGEEPGATEVTWDGELKWDGDTRWDEVI